MEEGRRINMKSVGEKMKIDEHQKNVCQNHTECFWHPPPSILPPCTWAGVKNGLFTPTELCLKLISTLYTICLTPPIPRDATRLH